MEFVYFLFKSLLVELFFYVAAYGEVLLACCFFML